MKNLVVNLLTALLVGTFTVYMIWQLNRPIKAGATPIAGATKQIMETTNEARLEAPVAGASKTLFDAMRDEPEETHKKTHKKTHKNRDNYIYASESTLNRKNGVFYGPSGKESYYNLPMNRVVEYMRLEGYDLRYWIRSDGVKMFGQYVMVAADLEIRPKGTILQTSLGPAMVCDTGAFARKDSTALDVAVDW